MKSLLASRGFVSVAAAAMIAVLTVGAYLIVAKPLRQTLGYCAIMPDAVGLYRGNHVTLRGIPVGTVTDIRAEGVGVRVEFSLDAEHRLLGQVRASTVADTVVADRNLAVLPDNTSTTPWNQGTCITETFTPKSISETLTAFSRLADQLGGGGVPGEQHRLEDGLAALDRATAGTGPKIDALLDQLGSVLKAPDQAVGHIGSLVDSLAALANSVTTNWSDIKVMLTQFGPGVHLINQVWDTVVQFVDSLLVVLPWINGITGKYGGYLLDGLESTVPLLKLAVAHIGGLQQLLSMIPATATAFQQSVDPATGTIRVSYAAPKVALPPEDTARVCAAVDALAPGRCDAAGGVAGLDVLGLLLGSVGAR
ncbi:MlaD family protein [Nocardia sp. NPDC127526]|uniref:MlaD family protein n=1 Tax=Nocardia sp. NPDC127526 TaxID=3345393 RepID=UPI00362AAECE